MYHFRLPRLLPRFQQGGLDLAHASLQGADLQGLIASWGATLQLPENVSAAALRIGRQPRGDLLPLSLEGVFMGAPPAQHAFSLLLLAVQGLKSCCRAGKAPLVRRMTRDTVGHIA